jgi:DDE superfamily endonuclease
MNPPRCTPEDYIDFLLASPKAVSALEAARVQPDRPGRPAHDAFTRLLHRLQPDPEALWQEVAPLVRKGDGVLVVDDSTLDKPYAHQIELVCQHWSGKHRAVVWGINLITLVWADGDRLYPVDYRVYDRARDGQTKNDHCRDLLAAAAGRGFRPRCVLFDTWYAGLDNLKRVRDLGWVFLAPLKANRLASQGRAKNRPLAEWPVEEAGTVLHLQGFGPAKVFRVVATNGDTEYWATNDLGMTELQRLAYAERAWAIEEYHRGLKQHCGAEKAQVRAARAQRNHIGCAIRALVRLEYHRFTTGVSWFQAKVAVVRDAVRAYLARPLYRLPSTA